MKTLRYKLIVRHLTNLQPVHLHWVRLTTSKKKQKKLLVTVCACIVTELFSIVVNDSDAKKFSCYSWVLVVTISFIQLDKVS